MPQIVSVKEGERFEVSTLLSVLSIELVITLPITIIPIINSIIETPATPKKTFVEVEYLLFRFLFDF